MGVSSSSPSRWILAAHTTRLTPQASPTHALAASGARARRRGQRAMGRIPFARARTARFPLRTLLVSTAVLLLLAGGGGGMRAHAQPPLAAVPAAGAPPLHPSGAPTLPAGAAVRAADVGGGSGVAVGPPLAPLFLLARPDLVVRLPPGAAPPNDSAADAAASDHQTDVRRYIVSLTVPNDDAASTAAADTVTAQRTGARAAAPSGGRSPGREAPGAPAPPPRLRSLIDAQGFMLQAVPQFDPTLLTHVFPAPPGPPGSADGGEGGGGGGGGGTVASASIRGFQGFSAFLRPAEVAVLRNDSARVEWIEEDSQVRIQLMPGQASLRSAMGLVNVNAAAAAAAATPTDSISTNSTTLQTNPASFSRQNEISIQAADPQFATRSWGLDRIDQRALPLDGMYRPNYNMSDMDGGGGSSFSSSASGWSSDSGGGDISDGSGVTLHIIDTGCMAEHREFEPRGRARIVYDRFKDRLNSDPNGHGTHTASVAGGQLVGVARGATLHCMRVLDADGAGTYSDILDAMSWIQQRRAEERAQSSYGSVAPAIMSLSLGGGYSKALNQKTLDLVAVGVHAVVAMGNAGVGACGSDSKGFSPAAAARGTPVVAVGSSGETDALSSFSNHGPCLTMSAPGENALGAWPKPGLTNTYSLLSATPADLKSILECSSTRSQLSGVPSGTAGHLLYANLRVCRGMALSPPIDGVDADGKESAGGEGGGNDNSAAGNSGDNSNNNNNNNNSSGNNGNNSVGNGGGSNPGSGGGGNGGGLNNGGNSGSGGSSGGNPGSNSGGNSNWSGNSGSGNSGGGSGSIGGGNSGVGGGGSSSGGSQTPPSSGPGPGPGRGGPPFPGPGGGPGLGGLPGPLGWGAPASTSSGGGRPGPPTPLRAAGLMVSPSSGAIIFGEEVDPDRGGADPLEELASSGGPLAGLPPPGSPPGL